MGKRDRKVFFIGLVASTFALMTTLKAQQYSFDSAGYYQSPRLVKGADRPDRVEVRPARREGSNIDLSGVYSKNVEVSYTNDRYPYMDRIESKRKVMRIARNPNAFQTASESDWVVRIGEEEVLPLGEVTNEMLERDNKRRAVRQQYGDLLPDEIAVGPAVSREAQADSGRYIYPNAINTQNGREELQAHYSVKNENYDEIKTISNRIREKKDYAWTRAESKEVRNIDNPWSSLTPDVDVAPIIRNTPSYARQNNKDALQDRQQALLHQQSYQYASPQVSYNGLPRYETSESYSGYYDENYGSYDDRFGYSTYAGNARVSPVNMEPALDRALLVSVDGNGTVRDEVRIVRANSEDMDGYGADSPILPAKTNIPVADRSNNISLTELKINFKPFSSDLSVKTMRWLKEFSAKAITDYDNIVEIRISPAMPQLQRERLLMLKGIMNSNGVYDHQFRIIANRRSADSIIVKLLEHKEDEEIPEAVDYVDMSGSYYYYY